MLCGSRLTQIALVVALVSASIPPQDRTAELRSRFSRETDPVHKAKLLPQLADSEFREIHSLLAAENLPEAARVAGQLADEAQTAVNMLDSKGRDPERHPEGYKQVEFSVRGSLRRIDEILVGLSADDQPPFLPARDKLKGLEQQLIRDLFPRRPDSPPAPAERKS